VLRPDLGASLVLDLDSPVRLIDAERPIKGSLQADWHNAHSSFVLDLARALRRAPDDRSRQVLLQQLAGTLNSMAPQ
jgi:hypothetical protein